MGSVLLQRGSLSSASDEKPLGRGLPIRTRRRRSKLPRESSESGREAQVAATYEDALQAMGGEGRDGRGVGTDAPSVADLAAHRLERVLVRGGNLRLAAALAALARELAPPSSSANRQSTAEGFLVARAA